MITVERKVDFSRTRRGRKQIHGGRERSKQMQKGADAPAISTGRVPRVSRLMALAISLDRWIREGEAIDQAELARLGRVSRARLTQVMNLLQLAPDIQEGVLHLPMTKKGRDLITERSLRPIAAILDWRTQRRLWQAECRTT